MDFIDFQEFIDFDKIAKKLSDKSLPFSATAKLPNLRYLGKMVFVDGGFVYKIIAPSHYNNFLTFYNLCELLEFNFFLDSELLYDGFLYKIIKQKRLFPFYETNISLLSLSSPPTPLYNSGNNAAIDKLLFNELGLEKWTLLKELAALFEIKDINNNNLGVTEDNKIKNFDCEPVMPDIEQLNNFLKKYSIEVAIKNKCEPYQFKTCNKGEKND